MGNAQRKRAELVRPADVVLGLPLWHEMRLALPANKERLLALLGTLSSSEEEFIEKASSQVERVRVARYVELREATLHRGVQPPVPLVIPEDEYEPEKVLRVEDLMPPLCSMWYHACKILFDVGMPEWDLRWTNESPYGAGVVTYCDESDPVACAYVEFLKQSSLEESKEHEYYGQNPFFQWNGDYYSACSAYRRLPTDYARDFLESQDNLVAGLEALGPAVGGETHRRVCELIDGLGENMGAWMGTDDFTPSGFFLHEAMPMYGGGMVDARLHSCATLFMNAMLDRSCEIAAALDREPAAGAHGVYSVGDLSRALPGAVQARTCSPPLPRTRDASPAPGSPPLPRTRDSSPAPGSPPLPRTRDASPAPGSPPLPRTREASPVSSCYDTPGSLAGSAGPASQAESVAPASPRSSLGSAGESLELRMVRDLYGVNSNAFF